MWVQGEWDLPLAIPFIGLSKLKFWAWALGFGLYTGTVPLHFFFLKALLPQARLQHLTSTDVSKCSFISLWGLRRGLHRGVGMRWKMVVTNSPFLKDMWQLSEVIQPLSGWTFYFSFSVQVLSEVFWIYVSWRATLDTASYVESEC